MKFTLTETINASAELVYNTWLNSDGHSKMTGGEATISNKIGDKFIAWNGYIEGRNIILEKNKKIVQTWRTSDFEDHEDDSQIEIVFTELAGQTELRLTHTNVPENGEHYIKGWEEHYFFPMKAYFN